MEGGRCLACSGTELLADTERDALPVRLDETLDAVTLHGSLESKPKLGAPREEWEAGRVLFDEFVVQRELGSGGMGVVYLVESSRSGQQHAVKRTRCIDPEAREALLAEVQTWKDLPEHPNLTACHFFRTLGDDVVIFAEYVDGGALDAAIRDHHHDWDQRTRFDLAIQFAFGLEAAHAAGFVHQDVKPGNALLSTDGVLKVTDFGLARTQQLLESGKGPAGLTPAFCSPEQAFRDQPVTASSDLWSWGVSVMELFIGEIRWQTGIYAPGVLRLYRSGNLKGAPFTMPEVLCDLLEVCFKTDVSERWASSAALCNALQSAWEAEYGEAYPRQRYRPMSGSRSTRAARTDPRRWLDDDGPALEELGDIGRLALFDRAARRVSMGVETGEFDAQELGELLIEKGRLHHATYDWPGALDAYREAKRLVATDSLQAEASAGEGRVLAELRKFEEAQRAFDRALELMKRADIEDGRRTELQLDRAETHWWAKEHDSTREALEELEAGTENGDTVEHREHQARYNGLRGNLALSMSEFDVAITHYEEACELYEDLVLLDGLERIRHRLGSTYFNLGSALTFRRRYPEAVRHFTRAIRVLENLVEQPGGRRWVLNLAMCHTNFGMCLRRMGNLHDAEEHLRQSVGSLERLVHLEGRRDAEETLTNAYLNLALALGAKGENGEAAQVCDRVAKMRRRKIEEEGRHDLRDRLAAVLGNHAYYLTLLDRNEDAIASYEESIEIREGLLREGSEATRPGLIRQLLNRAWLWEILGHWDGAARDANRAVDLANAAGMRDGNLVEALQRGASSEAKRGDLGTARSLLDRANAALIVLSEKTSDEGHLAEYQIRSAVLEVLCQRANVRSAVHMLNNHSAGTAEQRIEALMVLAAHASEHEPEQVASLIAQARSYVNEETELDRLEREGLLLLASGGVASTEFKSGLSEGAKSSGRHSLRRLAEAL